MVLQPDSALDMNGGLSFRGFLSDTERTNF